MDGKYNEVDQTDLPDKPKQYSSLAVLRSQEVLYLTTFILNEFNMKIKHTQ